MLLSLGKGIGTSALSGLIPPESHIEKTEIRIYKRDKINKNEIEVIENHQLL